MDLINRYLQAVKFWLPKNQKQDIIAELAEDLRSQIEDREAELGRQLNESEVAELLKQRPGVVSNLPFSCWRSWQGSTCCLGCWCGSPARSVNIVFCSWWLWWAGGHWYPTLIHLAGVTVTLAPVWRYFFWGYFLLGVVNTVASAVNVFRPYWTLERAVFRLLSDGAGSAICWLMKANIVAGISVVNVAPELSRESRIRS
jgi:hypothetical protein